MDGKRDFEPGLRRPGKFAMAGKQFRDPLDMSALSQGVGYTKVTQMTDEIVKNLHRSLKMACQIHLSRFGTKFVPVNLEILKIDLHVCLVMNQI